VFFHCGMNWKQKAMGRQITLGQSVSCGMIRHKISIM
jgi:hypothetical protein